MRLVPVGLVTLGLAALVGCNSSPPGGSHGTRSGTSTSGTAATGTATSGRSATFTIEAPVLSTTLKQGDTKEVKLTLDRGKDFHDAVDLKFEGQDGVTVDPMEKKVAAADAKEVVVKVTAAKDAAVGEHTVKVTGTPATGNATSVEFKVKVEESKAK